MTNICVHNEKDSVLSDGIRNRGRPFGYPFHSSEYPGKENIVKYGLWKCRDCGGWFPWFGGW